MRIVVLDGYTLNPGDLDMQPLHHLGECVIYDRTSPAELLDRAENAEILLTNKVVLSGQVLVKLPKLRYIGVLATGTNVVDIEAAGKLNIKVTNIPDYSTHSVAQMVMAHLLNLSNHVEYHSTTVRNGDWTRSSDFCYWTHPQIELVDLTMGIVGYGKIGRQVAALAKAFGMKIIAYSPSLLKSEAQHDYIVARDLKELFSTADVVSLHCPLTENNRKFVDESLLAIMKPSAFLINTGRGLLIDEEALAAALNRGNIAGAGLDVLSSEPPKGDNPLLTAKNCYITPHIAWATLSARKRLFSIAVANIQAFLSGKPQNCVV